VSVPGIADALHDWDAHAYDRVADPQEEWGREVLDRLPLEGDEAVLDVGCGSGRVTELLLERLPDGCVIGVDASPAMVAAARERLGDQAELRTGDLAELELEAPVDAVFSNAVFHWISAHDRLFERLYAALRPGGRLAAQCGARGNVASVRTAVRAAYERPDFAGVLGPPAGTWNFATAEETAERLRTAGFRDVEIWTAERPVTPAEPRAFLSTVVLGPHLERIPEELHPSFVDTVLGQLGEPPVLDYVRLHIAARRPG
jgi:trans-aconitate 2-methyltransferase